MVLVTVSEEFELCIPDALVRVIVKPEMLTLVLLILKPFHPSMF